MNTNGQEWVQCMHPCTGVDGSEYLSYTGLDDSGYHPCMR